MDVRRRLLAIVLIAGAVLACSPAPQGSGPRTDATVSALRTQVADLAAQLPPTPAMATATPIDPLTPANPVDAAVESLADEIAVEAAAAEIEPAPTAAPEPTPAPTPRPTAVPTRTPRPLTAEDAAPCAIGQVKGNRTSHIYHVPTGGSYARTKNKVECFDTEADAQAKWSTPYLGFTSGQAGVPDSQRTAACARHRYV